MISVQEHPIHCIDGKCIYMSKNSPVNNEKSDVYQDVYGKNDSHRRLEHLGIPIFVVQIKHHYDNDVQEVSHKSQYDVISDEIFDKMFSEVEKNPKTRDLKNKSKAKRETKKKRKASNK